MMMIMKQVLWVPLLLLTCGCGASNPTENIDGNEVYVFEDPNSGFESAEVFDANRESVFFSTSNELLYTPQGLAFAGFRVSQNWVSDDFGAFEIVFGREEGENRAYFVERFDGTLCDISVFAGRLEITSTDTFPPLEQ